MKNLNLLLCAFSLSISLLIYNVESLEGEGLIGGDIGRPGQFKYLVTIKNARSRLCGGGIIDEKFVLTAAHCVIKKDGSFRIDELSIVAGVADLMAGVNDVIYAIVKSVYVPKNYKPQNDGKTGDIAVLKLKQGLALATNPNLSKLELPKKPYGTYGGETVTIAGFGYNWISVVTDPVTNQRMEIGGSYDKVRFAEAEVLSNKNCNHLYIDPIPSSNLCARVKQRDPSSPEGVCSGDSGGPLVFEGKTVIGVVSTTPVGCTENQRPGIYTRVSSYVSFIENVLVGNKTSFMRVATWKKKTSGFGLFEKMILVES